MRGVLLLLMVTLASAASANTAGIAGHSGKEAGKACGACHKGAGKPVLKLLGPNTVKPGSATEYTVIITDPDLNAGGFNAAATDGQFDATSKDVKLLNNELTHAKAKWPDAKGDVVFKLNWIAPKKEGAQKIFVAAAAVDDDETSDGDTVAAIEFAVEVSQKAGSKVNGLNTPPVPAISGPASGMPGSSLYFNGIRSTDDGKIVSYEWDFGDGTQGKGQSVTHIYQNPGTYSVSLEIKDDKGEKAVASHSLNIIKSREGHPPPIALAGGPYAATVGDPVDLDASQSRAAKGYLTKYHWDFGDGSTGEGPKVSHAYYEPGLYQVILTVEDSEGQPVATNAYVKIESGSSARIVQMNFPTEISMAEHQEMRLPMAIEIEGISLPKDQPLCGALAIERGGAPFETKPVCLKRGEPSVVMTEFVVTKNDPPKTEWRAVLTLDNGFKTDISRKMKVSK
ncbi:MAG: PKD domain-containing protein [Pseudomonadota bacterium]